MEKTINMESLLVNLRKYRPREKTDSLENFITEAFAWLLRSSSEVQESILEVINERLDNTFSVETENCEISTQENFSGKYPDLVMSWSDGTLVFEHKVWSELHKNQLKNYRDHISKHSNNYRLILITAKVYQHSQKPDASLCWKDIYQCLDSLKSNTNDEKLSWAINDFLELLKSEGLGPSMPINRFSITHYMEAIKFDSQVDSVFQSALHKEWSLANIGIAPTFKRQKVETRVGLEFCPTTPDDGRRWLPGIFCGVLLDGEDHGVTKLLNNQLNLCLIFDFNKDGQCFIQKSTNYQKLRGELKQLSESTLSDWRFIDSEIEPEAKLNKWHPMMFIRPMLEVFELTTTHDEQVEKVFSVFEEIQKALINETSFNLLVEELSDK